MVTLNNLLKRRTILLLLCLVFIPTLASSHAKNGSPPDADQPLRTFRGVLFSSPVAKFSPDGKLLIMALGSSKEVDLIDTATWRTTRTLTLDQSPDWVAFSPDGKWMAIQSGLDVTIWSTASWRQVRRIHDDKMFLFLPGGRMLIADDDGGG